MTDRNRATDFVLGTLSPDARASVIRERLYNRALDSEISALERFYAVATLNDGRLDGDGTDAGTGADTGEQAAIYAPAMPSIWARIEGAVVAEAQALSGLNLEGFGDGSWQPSESPGVDFKHLWDENSILIRCVPGGEEPAHDQPADQDEHIIVVAGELRMGGRAFATGDYLCIPAGTTHAHMHSPTGCILFTQYR